MRQARLFGEDFTLHGACAASWARPRSASRTWCGTSRSSRSRTCCSTTSISAGRSMTARPSTFPPRLSPRETRPPRRPFPPGARWPPAARSRGAGAWPPTADRPDDRGRRRRPAAGVGAGPWLRHAQRPHLFMWPMLRSGADVLGLEPATTPVIQGRARARELGRLPVLEPGGTRALRARSGSPIKTFSSLGLVLTDGARPGRKSFYRPCCRMTVRPRCRGRHVEDPASLELTTMFRASPFGS